MCFLREHTLKFGGIAILALAALAMPASSVYARGGHGGGHHGGHGGGHHGRHGGGHHSGKSSGRSARMNRGGHHLASQQRASATGHHHRHRSGQSSGAGFGGNGSNTNLMNHMPNANGLMSSLGGSTRHHYRHHRSNTQGNMGALASMMQGGAGTRHQGSGARMHRSARR